MLRFGADPNDGGDRGLIPLVLAACEGHTGTVQKLIDYGCNTDGVDTESGRTALHVATENGHTDVCRILTEAGANPSVKDLSGFTPIEIAEARGRNDIVEILNTHNRNNHPPKCQDLFPDDRVRNSLLPPSTFSVAA